MSLQHEIEAAGVANAWELLEHAVTVCTALVPSRRPCERRPRTVALLDTRVDRMDPDLRASWIEERTFARGAGDPRHGTISALTLVGQGASSVLGLVPDARLLAACVVGEDGRATFEAVLAALEWVLACGATTVVMPLGGEHGDAGIGRRLESIDASIGV